MRFMIWFVVILQILVSIVRAFFPRKDPTVTVGLSSDYRHIVLTIDKGESLFLRREQGLVVEFEPWVTEKKAVHCMISLLSLETADPRMMSSVVSISEPNQRAFDIIWRARRDDAFAQRLLNRTLTALAIFQSNPKVQARATRKWRERVSWLQRSGLDTERVH